MSETDPGLEAAPEPVLLKAALSPSVHCVCGGYPQDREVLLTIQSSGDNPVRMSCELTIEGARTLVDVLSKCADAAEAIPLQ